MLEAVLFDLDGTLVDTAPDLCGTVNHLRSIEGLPPLPMETLRPFTSQGVRGLLRAGFGIVPDHRDYPSLSERFLAHYEANLCVESVLFPGMAELLDKLERQTIPWGIVTNKRARYTEPLVAALGLAGRVACVVSGDTTAESKPSPLPILHACQLVGCRPRETVYIGDDIRDIQAGKAAGTGTIGVSYGYLGDGMPIDSWNADFIADSVEDISRHLFR